MKTESQCRREASAAFDKAIAAGRLSLNPGAANYAGDFMFMGPDAAGFDTFKHRMTRRYIPLNPSQSFPTIQQGV